MRPVPLVLACGLTTLDVRQTVDRVPGPDEKVVARDLAVEVGGPAANAATTCTALGVRARLLTRVGGSAVGRIAGEDLGRHGVEVLDLAGPDDAPAVSTVLVTAATGQRAVASVNATRTAPAGRTGPGPGDGLRATVGETLDRAVREALDGVVHQALDGATAVLVDGHHLDLAVPVAAAARARGVVVVLDGGSWKPGLERLLAHVDVAVLSADFRLPDGAGDALEAVRGLGPQVVARSHGPHPVQLLHPGGRAEVPVPAVEVVDTLGAGDVLHGAAASWLACHAAVSWLACHAAASRAVGTALGAATSEALRFAVAVASASCAAPGARGWVRDDATVAAVRGALPSPTG